MTFSRGRLGIGRDRTVGVLGFHGGWVCSARESSDLQRVCRVVNVALCSRLGWSGVRSDVL